MIITKAEVVGFSDAYARVMSLQPLSVPVPLTLSFEKDFVILCMNPLRGG